MAVAFRGALVVFALLACLLALPGQSAAQAEEAPDIVFIVTDDQRWDTLWAMPTVQDELVDQGVTFSNAFATNPLCCPSRASTLTGRYSHGTGVYANSGQHGGFRAFDDTSTIATWLNARGYRTGLVGKYLVGYTGTYIPPGWDHWTAFSEPSRYYDYMLNDNGVLVSRGASEADYSTDVLAAEATEFIRSTEGPFFLYFAPFAPHSPATPATRHIGFFDEIEPWRPPSYNEPDVSDKPPWIRNRAPLTPEDDTRIDTFRQTQLESLLAADEAVGAIVDALADTGRLANTILVFTSDNGHTWGEHRWFWKAVPYEESIRVPLVIRYDPLTSARPRKDGHLVVNVDLAPTLARLAGTGSPGAQGGSLLPLLRSQGTPWRSDFVLEHLTPVVPPYCGVRSSRYTYIQYRSGEEELYDLAADPHQRWNRARSLWRRQTIAALRERVRSLCNPPPPGFTPRSPCLVTGTRGADTLRGTPYFDYVCAHSGADRIVARAAGDRIVPGHGSDLVYAQSGDDLIYGEDRFGTDRIYGGAGRDTIWAYDGRLDVVACGEGNDVANVDRLDRVFECETVRRR